MNYKIEKTGNNLNSIKENFDLIIEQIKICDDSKFINETIDKVKLAREWAKIQKKTEEMYSDLLRIEIECFRRIAKLNQLDVLRKDLRVVASFFNNLTVNEIEKIIKTKSGKSAISIYREYNYDYTYAEQNNSGRSFAKNEEINSKDFIVVPDGERQDYIIEIAKRKTASIATLLDDYSSKNENFTIEQFADDLILECGISDGYGVLSGFKDGVREVCRDAVRSAKTLYFKDKKTPRFVTCLTGFEKYVRIPFENATLSQFNEMIDLRKEQIKQDEKALENLIEIYDILNSAFNDLIENKKLKKNQKVLIKDIMTSI